MAHAQEQPAITSPIHSSRWRIWLARAGWLLIFALITGIFIASAPSARYNELSGWQFGYAAQAIRPYIHVYTFAAIVVACRLAVVAIFYAVALLIAFRKWGDWFALFVSAALLLVVWGFGARSDTSSYVFPIWLSEVEPLLTGLLNLLFVASWVLLFYLLPDGRFVPRRAGWLTLLIMPGLLLSTLSSYSAIPYQYRIRIAEFAWGILFIGILITILVGLYFQLYRYRNVATPAQRQQMKWILVGLAAQPLPLLFGITGLGGSWEAMLAIFVPLFVVTLLPVTIGLAVLRRRLWDVDPLINRSLVYGGLTLLVLVIYIALVGLAFVLFGERSNLLLAALAVGVAALLAQPIRARLQQAVNRLMYGDRDDPITVISELGRQLEHAAAPGDSLATLVETIGRSLKLPYVAIVRQENDNHDLVAEVGTSQPDLLRLPLIYQSQQVGELLVAPRAPGESFTAAERYLLDNVARQAGAAVYSAQLTDHLQRSREQLVLAREEERRRLQRDLHDGLGPQLATLSMQLDVARRLAAEGSPEAAELLGRLSGETQAAIADIRRLVYGLRPPALDQLGLAGALREYVAGQNQGTSGTRVTVEAPDALPPLPAAVEVAAYRIAQEAVANCLRHAHATECLINLNVREELSLEIRDNGRGLPSAVGGRESAFGVGLVSMRERAAELGGVCRIESAPGGGTRVMAIFPLLQEPQP
ncbi:MAG TPA: GAF domain-containing sensor histidine kinase [Promineifilum sp.]|nr:GAF domain-containing sensor histidine kinase [Promineifilum sp.]HRO91232.1 GAF domain-containing sensor histidine kinase [Promineifilum sp.]HRQ13427.1 GAF domain-containing sensor histidine kinase [Promineifilum sp.]